MGAGTILIYQSIQTYVVDVFTLHAASGSFKSRMFLIYLIFFSLTALAAILCLRSLAGFGFPLFAPAMFGVLGYGKGCTVLAGVSIALGCPAYVYVRVIHFHVWRLSICFFIMFIATDRGSFGSMGNGYG